jgi:hypothetical protein
MSAKLNYLSKLFFLSIALATRSTVATRGSKSFALCARDASASSEGVSASINVPARALAAMTLSAWVPE